MHFLFVKEIIQFLAEEVASVGERQLFRLLIVPFFSEGLVLLVCVKHDDVLGVEVGRPLEIDAALVKGLGDVGARGVEAVAAGGVEAGARDIVLGLIEVTLESGTPLLGHVLLGCQVCSYLLLVCLSLLLDVQLVLLGEDLVGLLVQRIEELPEGLFDLKN